MEYKDVFIRVIVKTLKDSTKINFLYEELPNQVKYVSKKEITNQISLFGEENEGMIILNMDRQTLKNFYYFIENEELEDDDFTIEDFCGEIGNIIAGKFIELLDIDINISLPMINFEPIEYSTFKKNPFSCFRFYANGNELFVYTYLSKLVSQ